VPLGPLGGVFSGTLLGGAGRTGNNSPGQELSYQFDVPGGLRDLALNIAVADTHNNLEGVLVDPSGQPVDVQTTITAVDPQTGAPTAYTNALQFFRRTPTVGRWTFILMINFNVSGASTTQIFQGVISFNQVRAQAPSLPDSAGVVLKAGRPVVVPITITNPGLVSKDISAEARLSATGFLGLGSISATLPLTFTQPPPSFITPPWLSAVTFAAHSPRPVDLDVVNVNGASPNGATFSPEVFATSGTVAGPDGQYTALGSIVAPEVAAGVWLAFPAERGPFGAQPPPPTTVQLDALGYGSLFDPTAQASTGDPFLGGYAPLTVAPGGAGTFIVTITPTGRPGTVVQGYLLVNALNPFSIGVDEMVALPYKYTVG
jgi:hypothetical protein